MIVSTTNDDAHIFEAKDKVTQEVQEENGATNHHYMMDRKPSTRKVMIVSTTNDDAHMFEAKDNVDEQMIDTNNLDASELQDKEVTQDVLGENGTTNHHYMMDRKPSTRKVMIVSTTNDDAHMFEAKDDVDEQLDRNK